MTDLFKKLSNEISNHKDIESDEVSDIIKIFDTEFDTKLILVAPKNDIYTNIYEISKKITLDDKYTDLNYDFFMSMKNDINNKLQEINIHDLFDIDKEKYISINNDIVLFYCYRFYIFKIRIPIIQE